jgi:hypothetical protein
MGLGLNASGIAGTVRWMAVREREVPSESVNTYDFKLNHELKQV